MVTVLLWVDCGGTTTRVFLGYLRFITTIGGIYSENQTGNQSEVLDLSSLNCMDIPSILLSRMSHASRFTKNPFD